MVTGVSPLSLLLTLVIVLVLFGTKRLRSIGEDLGAALRSFRKGLNEDENKKEISSELKNENRSNIEPL